MVSRCSLVGIAAALLALLVQPAAQAEDRYITVASTTSTANSGLFDHILPLFEEVSGVEVRIVAVGTGQALRLARNGDADALLVHHTPSEEAFVAAGYGIARHDVMYNDFIIVGPEEDPAGVADAANVLDGLRQIARAQAPFASRGDDSGTHQRERELWRLAAVTPVSGGWYRETGSGMGATLNTALGMNAYTLSDRATWLSFRNKAGFAILFEGDERLLNQYGAIAVNPAMHPHVKSEAARAFVDWLISPEGQRAIASFRAQGEQLFFPNAR